MISTGVEALDARMGGLHRGAVYALFGPAAAGKSVLGLHFLMRGLELGEECLLVTPEEPALLDSRAMYVGYGAARFTEQPHLRIARFPHRAMPAQSLFAGDELQRWLAGQVGRRAPQRIVIESFDTFVGIGPSASRIAGDIVRYLATTGATSCIQVRTDRVGNFDASVFAPVMDAAAGVMRLHVSERGERVFSFLKAPEGTFRAEPFGYTLRIGGGFAEDLPLPTVELTASDRRRLVILDELGALAPESLTALSGAFDVQLLVNSSGALRELSRGRYGALVMVVDPFDETRSFDLVFALRKEGVAAPIIFAAPTHGLRSSTRSRGLRAGADDFFVAELPASEMVERIQIAWQRGSHRRGGLSQIGQILQPMNGNGLTRLMTEAEFLQAMGILLSEQPALFFCYLEFGIARASADVIWPALRSSVRVGDGDIVGLLGVDRVGVVLDRITLEQAQRVVDRIRSKHAGLSEIIDITIMASPTQSEEISRRLEQRSAGLELSPVPL